MGTGTRNDNYTFYEGYEGEPEVIVSLPTASYHFWDGYLEDMEQYPGKMFTYQETKMVYEQLVSILKEAVEL